LDDVWDVALALEMDMRSVGPWDALSVRSMGP
jgi:hypothetical protein